MPEGGAVSDGAGFGADVVVSALGDLFQLCLGLPVLCALLVLHHQTLLCVLSLAALFFKVHVWRREGAGK